MTGRRSRRSGASSAGGPSHARRRARKRRLDQRSTWRVRGSGAAETDEGAERCRGVEKGGEALADLPEMDDAEVDAQHILVALVGPQGEAGTAALEGETADAMPAAVGRAHFPL